MVTFFGLCNCKLGCGFVCEGIGAQVWRFLGFAPFWSFWVICGTCSVRGDATEPKLFFPVLAPRVVNFFCRAALKPLHSSSSAPS